MTMPGQYQVAHPPVQNAMSEGHLHTPQSIFQHMMGHQNTPHQTGSWPQMPQVPPMMMPWSVPSLQQSQLVRFTGEKLESNFGKPPGVKRKIDVPDITEGHRTKQFITEEKMAAHFQDMHISSNYSHSAIPSTSGTSEPQPCCSTSTSNNCIDLDVDTNSGGVEDSKSIHPRLVISEELKRLQQEPMLPASLLSKLERPSMALVLWEPPSKHLRMLSTRQNINQFRSSINDNVDSDGSSNGSGVASNNESSMNNNHEDIPDMNQSLMEEPSNVELEPMDL